MGGACCTHGKRREKRPVGKPRHRREDIRMVLRALGWEGVDWMHLNQDRNQWRALLNTVMNLLVL
jgi:LmbE family N-acetylglucosaminyl deacetylase